MSEETRWYSLRVISGKERAIKERIDKEIKAEGWGDFIPNVVVPVEKVYKVRNGKKVIQERNILPGYILVEASPARLKDDIVAQIVNLQNVIHFLKDKENKPIPMQTHEAKRLLGIVDDTQSSGETMVEPYLKGEIVKINDGPFADFVGEILEINEEKKKLKVAVKIFGRVTEVELSFLQVEKQQ
jgi:transcription termination/antitermination protein NusG